MRNIFLLTIIASFIACNKGDDIIIVGRHPPIADIQVRFVDNQGNWIEGIEEKELKLLVADSEWNILKEQPPQVIYNHPIWWTENVYNYGYVDNGEEELVWEKKELLFIKIVTFLSTLRDRRNYINDETYGSYLVLQIDEKTSLNIQLVIQQDGFYNYMGPSIEKFICNGKEYDNIEYIYDSYSGKNILYQKGEPNDIVIE